MGGWVAGWLGGWLVGDDENKTNSAQLSCSLSWGWAELGKNLFDTSLGFITSSPLFSHFITKLTFHYSINSV